MFIESSSSTREPGSKCKEKIGLIRFLFFTFTPWEVWSPWLSLWVLHDREHCCRESTLGHCRVSETILQTEVTSSKTIIPYVERTQLVRPTIHCPHFPFLFQLQAWWRGTVVRNEIGGFRLPKKDKDDSKDSKGKGKDKDKRRGKKWLSHLLSFPLVFWRQRRTWKE